MIAILTLIYVGLIWLLFFKLKLIELIILTQSSFKSTLSNI